MRDKDHRGAESPAQFAHQINNAGLHRHVKRRSRLIEQQQRGLGQQRHSNHDALLLAAGKLVRIRAHDALGVRQLHRLHHVQRALAGFGLGHLFVGERHFHQLIGDAHRRIEAGHRLLIDHGDLRAAQAAQFRLVHLAHVAAAELDLAPDFADARQVAHDGQSHGGLAATGLTHQSHAFARQDGHGKIHHSRNFAGLHVEGNVQVFNFEDRCGHDYPLNRARIVRAGCPPAG